MTAAISIRNVVKRYTPRGQIAVPVLQGFNLTVQQGDFLALMGPSGSGKTTILNLMGGIDRPNSGEVVVGGTHLETSRLKSSWVIIVALMCVAIVLLSMLSMEEGIKLAYLGVGHADRAMISSSGIQSAFNSSIPQSWVGEIAVAPGIRRGRDGTPLVDAQTYGVVDTLAKRSNGKPGYTSVRGFGAKGFEISSEIRMVDGRRYRPGTREVVVGVTAQRKFTGLQIGDRVSMIDGGAWIVVGHFSTGSFTDGDLIVDPQVLSAALKKPGYTAVLVSLKSAAAFDQFKSAVAADPALTVTVERQSDYWKRLYQGIPSTPLIVAYVVSLLLAAGAISGILHTMHATVSSRAREIAILRAVGFGGLPVAVSVVLEAMLFAAIGATIGTAIDWLWLNDYAYNGAYGVFRVAVTPHLLAVALGWALVTALVGAFMPATQEARLTVVEALGRL